MRSLLLLCLLLVGCAKIPPTRYYLLEPAEPSSSTQGVAIEVAPIRVDPPYDQDRLVYRERGSTEVGFYAYHRWAAPLDEMLTGLVATTLDATDGIESLGPAEIKLQGRVRELGEIDEAGVPGVRIRVELQLVDSSGETLWRGALRGERRVETDEVEELVQALSDLLVERLSAISAEIAAAAR